MSFGKKGAACLLGCFFVFANLSAHAEVFINEIHYDDAETPTAGDQNEAVEVVATNGEDLSLYDIVLYNGSNAAAAIVYDTDAVPAGSLVTCGSTVRIGVVTYTSPAQVQNGGNDAIALVRRSDSTVVQFLSYEGAATASAGPASGQTSIAIPVSETNSTAEGTSLQLGGTGATYANFAWNASATSSFGSCNNNQVFNLGPQVNVLPFVVSTSPANGGTMFTTSNTVLISFNESVSTTNGAAFYQCTTSSHPQIATSLGGENILVTTATQFVSGESCVLTVPASSIADSENAHPAQDIVVNFNVITQPNQAPLIFAITPLSNAVGVPAATDITVFFTEHITADPEAFVLQCSASGLIQPSINTAGNPTIVLSTNTALQAGENCTLTVIAAGILDDNGLAMTQNYVSRFTIAGNISAYYNRVNTSSAEQLRCSLNTTIRDHTVYPYSAGTTDTWDILEIADEDPNNSGKILDVYRNRSYIKVSSRAGTGSGLTYNREHTWPNSLGFGTDTGNLGLPHAPYTDTHMLYLSDTQYNSDRGNDPYANCSMASGCGERATEVNNGSGGGSGVYPGNSNWTNGSSFETWSKRKGDVARAVMYMAIRYEGGTHGVTGQNEPDLELTDNRSLIVGTSSSPAYMGLMSDLLQWHLADPPDAAELARNQIIFNFQGNRNPFIDHPEWATAALFNSSKPTTCILNTPEPAPDGKYRPILKPRPPTTTR